MIVPRGVYFSKTVSARVGKPNHAMKVFTYVADDQAVRRPDEAFVTDENHRAFADNLDFAKNKHMKVPLMTTNFWSGTKPPVVPI